MMLLKCCTQHASKFGKLNSGHRILILWSCQEFADLQCAVEPCIELFSSVVLFFSSVISDLYFLTYSVSLLKLSHFFIHFSPDLCEHLQDNYFELFYQVSLLSSFYLCLFLEFYLDSLCWFIFTRENSHLSQSFEEWSCIEDKTDCSAWLQLSMISRNIQSTDTDS